MRDIENIAKKKFQQDAKTNFGNRLTALRGKMGKTREEFLELMNNSSKAPFHYDAEGNREVENQVTESKLKSWEYGYNRFPDEWMPALCDVGNCDEGYLFGVYDSHTYKLQDIKKTTGLSEEACKKLSSLSIKETEFLNDLLTSLEFSKIAGNYSFYKGLTGFTPEESKKQYQQVFHSIETDNHKDLIKQLFRSAMDQKTLHYFKAQQAFMNFLDKAHEREDLVKYSDESFREN